MASLTRRRFFLWGRLTSMVPLGASKAAGRFTSGARRGTSVPVRGTSVVGERGFGARLRGLSITAFSVPGGNRGRGTREGAQALRPPRPRRPRQAGRRLKNGRPSGRRRG